MKACRFCVFERSTQKAQMKIRLLPMMMPP